MGNSSDNSGPSDSDFGRAHGGAVGKGPDSNTGKDSKEARARSRKTTFQNYQKQREAAKKGIDISITSREAKDVRDNASIAMDFDKKSKNSKINIPGLSGVALSTIQSINYNNIAAGLRGGGYAVTSSKDGSVQGVVNNGAYTGNLGYSPIGRSSGASFSMGKNQYSVDESQNNGPNENDSQVSNSTKTNTQTTALDKTDSTKSLSTASRRSLLSSGGGGASRRNLL